MYGSRSRSQDKGRLLNWILDGRSKSARWIEKPTHSTRAVNVPIKSLEDSMAAVWIPAAVRR